MLPVKEFESALDKFDEALKPISQVAYFEYEIDGELSDCEFSSAERAMDYAKEKFFEYHETTNEGEYNSKYETAYVVALDEDKKEIWRDSFDVEWERIKSDYDEHNTYWGKL